MNAKIGNLYEEVTAKIVTLLKDHLETWDLPWVMLDAEGNPAHNAYSDTRYHGINQLLLSFMVQKKNYLKNGWMTFHQIKQLGGNVRRGEKSTEIIFWSVSLKDSQGNIVSAEEVKNLSREDYEARGITRKGILKYFNVFNIYQTSGLPDEFYHIETAEVLTEFQKDERAEQLLEASGAEIGYQKGGEAYYIASSDLIMLPERSQFMGQDGFYATVLHELSHWTGHPSRLNRPLKNTFGSREYALEELVAELSSAFLCAELGFSKQITKNASYIQSWLKALDNDPNFVLKAARLAEQASEHILAAAKAPVAY